VKKFLIIFVIISAKLFAQSNPSISGFVREDATGEPLSYVNVFLKGTFLGTATRLDGYYVIPSVPPGKYEIIVSIIGYEHILQPIVLKVGEDLRIDFRLKVAPVTGEEVTVVADRIKFKEAQETSTINITMREINVVPGFIELMFSGQYSCFQVLSLLAIFPALYMFEAVHLIKIL